MRKMRRWLLPAMTVLASTTAQARMDPAAIEIAAMGIAAYEMNKDKCAFEGIIHSKFKELDGYFRDQAPHSWDRAKRKATVEIPATLRSGMLGTDTTKTGVPADCANAGKLMNLGMVPAMFFVMSDAAFGAALKRLSESGARARETGQISLPIMDTEILNFKAMQPFASAYESCWVTNQENGTNTDCMIGIDPKLRALNNGTPVSKHTRDYSEKFLENIMFATWYNRAIELKLPWNARFPDAENLSNGCVEMESVGTANRHQVIDCINKGSQPHLIAAWKFLNAKPDEAAEIDRYFTQTMLACLKQKIPVNDTDKAIVGCLIQVGESVGNVDASRAFSLGTITFAAIFYWLQDKQVYVPFQKPSEERNRCMKLEKKLACMLTSASQILKHAQNSTKDNPASLKEAF